MRLYFKLIILGIIVGIVPSLLAPNLGFILGGLVVGYFIADTYLDGAIDGLVSQAIAGLLVSFIISLLTLIIFNNNPFPYSQFLPETNFLNIIVNGVIYALIGSVIGGVCGILGVLSKKIIEEKIAFIGILGALFLIGALFAYSGNYDPYSPLSYSQPEDIYNVYIGNSSDGLWHVNFTTGIFANMNYFGIEMIWADSSNQLIMRQLVYNQTHVVKGQVFNISQSFNLSESPFYVDILFFDNPDDIGDINKAHAQAIYKYQDGDWIRL